MNMASSPYDKAEVGRRLVILRKAYNDCQQNEMAALLGIKPPKLNNYEKGLNLIPIDIAGELCSITGANFDYIYRGMTGTLPAPLQKAIIDIVKRGL